jgi:hypothetical protein
MSKIARGFSFLLVGSLCVAGCDKGPTNSGPPTSAKAVEPAKAPAVDGTTYGAGVKLAEATPIDTILADPNGFKGKTVRVEGMVTNVCERRGCWFEMAGTGAGLKLRFKVADGAMTFPVEAKGKYAVAQGEVAVNELSLEQTREYAVEEAQEKGEKLDPATVTKPTLIVRLDGTGAVVREKR